jgi:hypothetical protein
MKRLRVRQLAGGAFQHGTDYSFVRGHEDGSFAAPGSGAGGGSTALCRQLGILHGLMKQLDFLAMAPAPNALPDDLSPGGVAVAIAEAGRCFAIHLSHDRPDHHGLSPAPVCAQRRRTTVRLELSAGRYRAQWFDTMSGKVGMDEPLAGPAVQLTSPDYQEDIALLIRNQD